jgi:hypothetical protein
VIFVSEWQNGEVVSILDSFGTKSLVCKDAVNRDSTIQSTLIRLCTAWKIEEIGSLSAVWTIVPSRSDTHLSTVPFVRTTCHTVWTPTNQASSVQTTYISVWTLHYVEKFLSNLHPSGRLSSPSGRLSVLDQLQILSKFKCGKTDSPVRTMWYPVRRRISLRQESQFKCHHPDVSQPWSGRAFNS